MSLPHDYHLIPEGMRGAVIRYVCFGIFPGGFLCAVIRNDLHEAAMRADGPNILVMHIWACLLHNHFPVGSWRTQEAMDAWNAARQSDPLEISDRMFPESWIDAVNGVRMEMKNV